MFNYAASLPVDRAAQIKQALRDSQGRVLVAYVRPGTTGVTEVVRIRADATRDPTFPLMKLPGTQVALLVTTSSAVTWAVNQGDSIEYGTVLDNGEPLADRRGTIVLADVFPSATSRPVRSLRWVGISAPALLQLTAKTGDSVSSDARSALFYFSGLRRWNESTGVGMIEGEATLTPITGESMRWGYFARRSSGTILSGTEHWRAGTVAMTNGGWTSSVLAEGSTPLAGDNAVPVDGVVDQRGGLFLKKGDTIRHVLADGSEDPRFSIKLEHPRAAEFRMRQAPRVRHGGAVVLPARRL